MNDNSGSAMGLLHMIYPYEGAQQYVSGTLAYIERAREDGAAVVVAAPGEHRDMLRSHLDGAEDDVAFMDTAAVGRNPSRLIPAWRDWIGRQAEGRAVHGINDAVWPLGAAAYDGEARYTEWLLNQAFAKTPAWSLLCPVDTTLQPAPAIEALTACHPLVWNGTGHSAAEAYNEGPYVFDELAPPPESAERMAYRLDDLAEVRARVRAWARRNRLPEVRTGELTLAVSEVATNSIRYGGGCGTLHMWTEENSLVCELRDAGVITDALVGLQRPPSTQLGGRGLWYVYQMCDLVQLRSAPEQGTRVRLWIDMADRDTAAERG